MTGSKIWSGGRRSPKKKTDRWIKVIKYLGSYHQTNKKTLYKHYFTWKMHEKRLHSGDKQQPELCISLIFHVSNCREEQEVEEGRCCCSFSSESLIRGSWRSSLAVPALCRVRTSCSSRSFTSLVQMQKGLFVWFHTFPPHITCWLSTRLDTFQRHCRSVRRLWNVVIRWFSCKITSKETSGYVEADVTLLLENGHSFYFTRKQTENLTFTFVSVAVFILLKKIIIMTDFLT